MSKAEGIVTWHDAQDAMLAAFDYLAAMPDRDRAFLSAGSRSCWPQIVREAWEYADGEAVPSARLTRRRLALVDAMLTGPRPAASAVPQAHRRLVGRVITMKLWPGPDVFGWERIWDREGGRRSGATSDALRMRYERAIGKIAVRMTVLGLGVDIIDGALAA